MNYLEQAAKLTEKASQLSDGQKKAIEALEKRADKLTDNLEMALKLIERDVKNEVLTATRAKVKRAEVEALTEEAISEIHTKIREINPSFVSNAREQVEDVVNRAAYGAVEFSGKAAGMLGQVIRPFIQAAKEGYQQGKKSANSPYRKPEPRKSTLDQLEAI